MPKQEVKQPNITQLSDTTLSIGHIPVEISKKQVKHMYLKISPQRAIVRATVPLGTSDEIIRRFLQAKQLWIEKYYEKFTSIPSTTAKRYIDGEVHELLGNRYELQISYTHEPPRVSMSEGYLILHIRYATSLNTRRALMDAFYRATLQRVVAGLVQRWSAVMGVKPTGITFRKMRTRWGVCRPHRRAISLNLFLAKTPLRCIEYVVVHEMIHLLETGHNKRFYQLMDRFLPQWEKCKEALPIVPR